jgi:thiamine biosynthesis lipoprotein
MLIEPEVAAIRQTGTSRHVLNGPTMGTRYAAAFYAAGTCDLAAIGTALEASVSLVDGQMSTWRPDSDLVRFNRSAVGVWVGAPAALLKVIATGLDIGRRSGGAFDIGVGDLVTAWGFGAGNAKPDVALAEKLARDRRCPTHEVLELDLAGGRLRKVAPVSIDLSGIAKGFGVDELAAALESFGITDYLVSIDGEVRSRGSKPGNNPWRVAVEKPDRKGRDVAGVVELADGALATSGNYRHWVDVAGQSFSHSMDPRTGRPLQNGIAAVTVRAQSCMLADAWATALLVLGEQAGRALAGTVGVEALYIAEA